MNFSIDGLMGFDVKGKTVGIVGTGAIGRCFCDIMRGFGCHVLAHDPRPNPELSAQGVKYVSMEEIFSKSDIVSLHCPWTPSTHHLIDAEAVESMKPGVMIINTSRGALLDTSAVIEGLKQKRIGALGIDVYEEESGLFYEDHSNEIMQDEMLARLLTFPNVIVTGHQAFFTKEAIQNIAETTLSGFTEFAEKGVCKNAIVPEA
jgi:D-lactate dehydrogenase